ncbi:MAG: alpha/beta fold hydrolase [Clostridia bacterium]
MVQTKEFETYKGISPVPADFDEYWNRALSELEKTDRNVSVTEANFKCPNTKCYDLYYTGVGGARIYAKYLCPARVENKIPAMILFHGYSDSSGDWFDKLSFVQAGFAVFIMDCRGQGGKSEDIGGVKGNTLNGHFIRGLSDDNPDKLLYRSIYLDAVELVKIAMDMDIVDNDRIYVNGGSNGGALAVVCAALVPDVKKAAIMYPFLSDFKKVMEIGETSGAYAELKEYFHRFDPRHECEDIIFNRLGYIDVKNLAPRIKAEVLMFTGMTDTCCPPITQYAVYNNMKCKKQHILYPEFGHEGLRGAADIILQFFIKE